MNRRIYLSIAGAVLAAAAWSVPALAQRQAPSDLTVLPPIPNDYRPAKTAWGDPDFRGTWPINDVAEMPVSRPDQYGDRFFKTEEELAKEEARIKQLETGYSKEEQEQTIGSGHWIEYLGGANRTSMISSPRNGKLPAMTPAADALYKAGRSSWTPNTQYNWVTDFDSWDRCVSRGFPASMLPFRYNNGIRILQAPGQVAVHLEMLGTRLIPVVPKAQWAELQKTRWSPEVRTWLGQSLGYWDDENTLVIETTNIKSGDSATKDRFARNGSPLNMATRGVPAWNTIPTGPNAKVTERLHMVGPNTITYEMTYNDPAVFTAPWTLQFDWTRDDDYEFFEYACHEGNVQVRNYITSSRAGRIDRASEAELAEEAGGGGSR